ncbi:hypothetical protein Vadar_027630 [Vaccinium darrowii]|uniref:Uncharacterized protein n=1 Tax=Vaccinium darrowii TaxID=229202 RepID=A0ACB7YAH8_9ERIC|nr:hypothetical protein Vadar_027630 [Vaccinium darrowii]
MRNVIVMLILRGEEDVRELVSYGFLLRRALAPGAPASFSGAPPRLRPPSQVCPQAPGLRPPSQASPQGFGLLLKCAPEAPASLFRRAPRALASFSGEPPGLPPPPQACPWGSSLLLRRAPRAPASFSDVPLGVSCPPQAGPWGSGLLLRRVPMAPASSSGVPLGPQPPPQACPQGSRLLLRRAPVTPAFFSGVLPGAPVDMLLRLKPSPPTCSWTSALEENNELGIAHMLEHLAFTAVEFKDPDVKKYLETLLTSGGPCKSLGLTGCDFTLYSFSAKNEKELTQAISVLARISSEYEQLTIGKAEIIKGVSAETVNNFYRKWYQLPRMSIVIVGDTDSESMVNLISTFFGSKEPDLGTKEPNLGIPPFREPHISCFIDPSIETGVLVTFGLGQREPNSLKDLKAHWAELVFIRALGIRFERRSNASLDFHCRISDDGPEKVLHIHAECLEGMTVDTLEKILTENFLFGRALVDSGYAAQLQRTLIPAISSAEVLRFSNCCRTTFNCCIMIMERYPPAPATEVLKSVVEKINSLEEEGGISSDVEPLEETVLDPLPGTLMEKVDSPKVGATELLLSNGMHVCYKDTNLGDELNSKDPKDRQGFWPRVMRLKVQKKASFCLNST